MTPATALFGEALVSALGWTLLHFVWQGAAIAALLAVADLALQRATARARYAAACGALALMLVVAVGTFLRAPRMAATAPPIRSAVLATGNETPGSPATLRRSTSSLLDAPRVTAIGRHHRPALRWDRAAVAEWVRAITPWLVRLWFAGVAVLSLRLIGGWWLTRRLLARSLSTPLAELDAVLESLKRRLALSTPVRLCRSAWVEVPTVTGWLRPVILLPMSTLTGLSPRQLDALLAHELAHIRRHDYLVNLVQSAVETLLFYHPAVWWVSRRVREERECCCDDVAVAVCGDALTYARALAELERLRAPRVALAASGGSLLSRIQRLVGASRIDSGPNWTAGVLGAGLALVLLGVAGLGWGMTDRDAPLPLRAIERRARIEARQVAAQAREISRRVSVAIAATAGQIAAVPPVLPRSAVAPAAPPSTCPSTAIAPEAEVECQGAGSCTHVDADAPRALADHGVDRAFADGLRSQGFDDDEIVSLHDHGLTPDQVQRMRSAARTELDADDLVQLHDQGVPPEYVRALSSPGQPQRSVEDLVTLHAQGVQADYVRRIAAAGLSDVATEDLVALVQGGVSSDYVLAMSRSGRRFDPGELIQLSSHGVSAALVASLVAGGRNEMPLSEIIELSDHGVGAGYVSELSTSMDEPLPTASIVALHDRGISAEWMAAMSWLGYDDPQRSDLIRLQENGITPEYVFAFRSLGFRDLRADDLIQLRSNGVDADEVAMLRGLGAQELTVESIVALRTHGVTADYFGGLRRAGLRRVAATDLVQLYTHGVSAEDVGALTAYGLNRLEPADVVRLHDHGVDASFLREAARAGDTDLSVDELIRLHATGIRGNEPSR